MYGFAGKVVFVCIMRSATAGSYHLALETLTFLTGKVSHTPRIALVLGSGMGAIAGSVEDALVIPFAAIPHFPVSTVPGHAGNLICGRIGGVPVVVMQGRCHYYEGYSMEQVVFPVRVFGLWGIRSLVLTNAAGGLSPEQEIGEVMWISDHINLMGTNPLIGPHEPEWGVRFPDMSRIYPAAWIEKAMQLCREEGQRCSRGVYMGVSGPTYETPAEYRAFRRLGADAVGMSTVPEAIAARQMGMDVLAFSVISDLGVEGEIVPVSHEKVLAESDKAAGRLARVLARLLPDLAEAREKGV